MAYARLKRLNLEVHLLARRVEDQRWCLEGQASLASTVLFLGTVEARINGGGTLLASDLDLNWGSCGCKPSAFTIEQSCSLLILTELLRQWRHIITGTSGIASFIMRVTSIGSEENKSFL